MIRSLVVRAGDADGRRVRADRLVLLPCAALLLAQLIGMCVWSTDLWNRSALTQDAAIFLQAAWLVSHGHLSAPSSITGTSFWADHSAFMWLPASALDYLPPHGLWLFYLQDACIVAAEAIGLVWVYDRTRRCPDISPAIGRTLVGLCALLLAANPWTYEAASWDLHIETFGSASLVAAAYCFWRGRIRLAWAFSAVTMLWGDVCTTWVIGLGLTLVIVGIIGWATPNRRLVRHGIASMAIGIAWLGLMAAIHGASGGSQPFVNAISSGSSTLQNHGHASILDLLVSVLTHPLFWVGPVWSHRVNVFATVAPSGAVGALAAWVIGIAVVILIPANFAASSILSVPGYQQVPLMTLTTVGTVFVVIWLMRRWPARSRSGTIAGSAAIALLAVNSVAWAVVWLPTIRNQWLLIPRVSGTVIDRARAIIPQRDEVVASQGFSGAFARRRALSIWGGVVRVRTRSVWFVVSPMIGIEPVPAEATLTAVGRLVNDLHAHLVLHRAGIFVLHWLAPPQTTSIDTAGSGAVIPAWTIRGRAGAAVTTGPPPTWHVVPTGAPGDVISGDYWTRLPGRYTFHVRLARTTKPFTITVWDRRARVMVAQVLHQGAAGNVDVPVPVTVLARGNSAPPFSGVGPFSISPLPPSSGQVLELVISTRVANAMSVTSIALDPAP